MTRPAGPIDTTIGMELFASETDGIGGRLRSEPTDFHVREIELFDVQPIDADPDAYPHLVFRARLVGWDTNDFASAVSDRLGISRERVRWAGTKDKRAISIQLFSVDGIAPEDLPSIGDATLEVIGRAGRGLDFGDLVGNAFEIRIQDTTSCDRVEAITAELVEFRDGDSTADDRIGVPNFFGHQRFGSRRPVTHTVGMEIVRGRWRDAVLAYLGNPTDREPAATRRARAAIDDGESWADALARFPAGLRYERSMLHSLVETGGTESAHFRTALETLPSSLQRLFVHAAQSYLFNRILCTRIRSGLPIATPVAGDVVCFAATEAPEDVTVPDIDRSQAVTPERVRSITRHCARGRAFVTAPLIGSETTFAVGEQGEIERAVLESVGLDRQDFDRPDPFGSNGTRRAMLVTTAIAFERNPVTMSFALPKGSYATVVLREYMKVEPTAL